MVPYWCALRLFNYTILPEMKKRPIRFVHTAVVLEASGYHDILSEARTVAIHP